MRRIFSRLISLMILMGTLTLAVNIQPVRASGTTYIRADGSIDPPEAPISTADNVTYSLTGNITSDGDGIIVERDSIVVDGAGYTLTGSGSGNGTTFTDRSNVTVRNMTIRNFYRGILLLSFSNNNTLSGNNVTANNNYGIWLEYSSDNTLYGNYVANNGYGVRLDSFSNNNTLSGNNVTGDEYGILLSSSNNTLSGNNVTANNYCGIWLEYSSDTSLYGNYVANNGDGIILGSSSSNNTLSGNNVANNGWGILLVQCYGNNVLYHNNFINNTQHVHIYIDTTTPSYANFWDDGYPSGGN